MQPRRHLLYQLICIHRRRSIQTLGNRFVAGHTLRHPDW
jgi:hypothetical protein